MLCGSPGRTACPLEAARLVRALQSSTETSHSSSPHGRWPTPAGMKQPSLGTSCKVGSIVLSHAARASEQPALDLHFFADAASRALLAAADRTACRGRFDPLGDYRAASRCARISSPPFRWLHAGTKKTQATQETLKVFLPERHRFGLLLALLAWIFFLFITRWLKLRLTGILPPLDLGPPHLSLLAPVLLLLLRQGGLNVVGKLLQVPPASTALAVGIPEVLSVGRVDVELTLARRPSYTGEPPKNCKAQLEGDPPRVKESLLKSGC